jgi:hypothetical protein
MFFLQRAENGLVLLPCLHCVCVSCQQLCDINQQSLGKSSCAKCKSEMNKTSEEAGIFGDSPISQYFDKIKTPITQLVSTPVQCDVCNSGLVRLDIMRYCTECHQHLCNSCSSGHGRINATRGHRIVPAKDRLPLDVDNKCKIHQYELTIFCHTCNLPVCYLCCVASHVSHDCTDIKDVAKERRSLLQNEVEKINQSMSSIRKQFI